MTTYLVRKKLISLGDDFWVEDESGEKVFHVGGKLLRLRDTYVIESADGDELLKIKEQRLKLRKTFAIERQGEQLATLSKALLTPLRDKLTVDLAGDRALEAKGDLFDHEFTIKWENGVTLAEVSKRWFSVRDTYGLTVHPDQDAVLALAITVCIDAIEHD